MAPAASRRQDRGQGKAMKRDTYWQMIRGICIIAVIMIHCPTALNPTTATTHPAKGATTPALRSRVAIRPEVAHKAVATSKVNTPHYSTAKSKGRNSP